MKMNRKSFIVGLALVTLLSITGCATQPQPVQLAQPVKAAAVLDTQIEAPVTTGEESAPLTTDENSAPIAKGAILEELETTLADIYASVNPSVVSILVSKQTTNAGPGGNGAGSGFVWDSVGHIVTNNHVVEGADTITVQFSDGSTTEAQIVGTDRDSDLAVISVDVSADKLHPVSITETKNVSVGHLAIAIGNPFGLGNTMTVGFISALGRSLPVEQNNPLQGSSYTIPSIIQTDAPINPGNSGGVLVNGDGEVVGVTTAIISPVQASVGIGFAIPSDIVTEVVPALIQNGSYKHAWLGFSGFTLTAESASAMNLPEDTRGVAVATVIEGSPVAEAGLLAGSEEITVNGNNVAIGGDVITAFDNTQIEDFEDLVALLSMRSAGESVTLSILRDGSEMTLNVTLGERPVSEPVAQTQTPQNDNEEETQRRVTLGISGMTLNEDIALAMNLDADQTGVLVGNVLENSPAANAGLLGSDEPATIGDQELSIGGDVITGWDGDNIMNLNDLRAKVAGVESNSTVDLTVIRNGETLTLTLEF